MEECDRFLVWSAIAFCDVGGRSLFGDVKVRSLFVTVLDKI
ncbi:MAG: hypothetical protein ACKPBB_18510 [Sphaerospermopsis kisseleviana]